MRVRLAAMGAACWCAFAVGAPVTADGAAAGPPEPRAGAYYDLIGIGWADTPEGGARIVWRPQGEGIDPTESMRIFKYLEGGDVTTCLTTIIDSRPELRAELLAMGVGTACGGTPEAIARTRDLWTAFGVHEALAEVAHEGRRGEAVARLLARCDALRGGAARSGEKADAP